MRDGLGDMFLDRAHRNTQPFRHIGIGQPFVASHQEDVARAIGQLLESPDDLRDFFPCLYDAIGGPFLSRMIGFRQLAMRPGMADLVASGLIAQHARRSAEYISVQIVDPIGGIPHMHAQHHILDEIVHDMGLTDPPREIATQCGNIGGIVRRIGPACLHLLY